MTDHLSTVLPETPAEALWSAWTQTLQVPLVITACCWNAMVETMWPIDRHALHWHHTQPLVVPEPLDEDTAPSLFA